MDQFQSQEPLAVLGTDIEKMSNVLFQDAA